MKLYYTLLYYCVFCIVLSVSVRVQAQVYQLPVQAQSKPHFAGLEVNGNPTLKAGVTGGWQLAPKGKHTPLLMASLRTPIFLVKHPDTFEAGIGIADYLTIRNQWGVTVALSGTLATTRNTNARLTTLGTELVLLPGYRANRWYAGAWLGWQYKPVVHLHHSEYIEDTFKDRYKDGSLGQGPVNGWVALHGSVIRLGAAAGYSLKSYSFHLNGGFQSTPGPLHIISLPDVGILPFFGSISIVHHW
ncbi:hypothetical protein [Xanthocytophaga agilis]|uniref:Outer membrane protein beta-barrel domain-containing protein n=1 Tax=Xanthocytophaga agilis TaxID=3048010 RepID=A0AAE3RBX6_9BACT|nr:hypothetical protein [Xanthocytophaga agilis]MDJ1505339.1 hypothetical protein [Xanthocytophaga agilis]